MNINKLILLTNLLNDKKIPEDIYDTLKKEYYSEGRNNDIEIGDMDLFHLLRSFNLLLLDRKKLHKILNVVKEGDL